VTSPLALLQFALDLALPLVLAPYLPLLTKHAVTYGLGGWIGSAQHQSMNGMERQEMGHPDSSYDMAKELANLYSLPSLEQTRCKASRDTVQVF
jgi:hypothetical protein